MQLTVLLAVVAAVAVGASAFGLEGNWTLSPSQAQPTSLTVSDLLYRNSTILTKLAFSYCSQQMLLQAQVSDNQLFLNLNSHLIQPFGASDPCPGSDDSGTQLASLFASLSKVFYFQINVDSLLLKDPHGLTLLAFTRAVRGRLPELQGVWSMSQFGSTRTALSVEVGPTNITLCQGQAVYIYSFPHSTRNTIQLTPVLSQCPSQELVRAVEAVRYFRRNGNLVELYDQDVNVAVVMAFSGEYDPAQPVFGTQSGSRPVVPIPTPPKPEPSNLGGEWSIESLFRIPFSSSPYSLSFSPTAISLKGGCNQHRFPYLNDQQTQVVTVAARVTLTLRFCTQDDDQLYASGVEKMHKYLFDSPSGQSSLTFYASDGSPGYRLNPKRVGTQGSTVVAPPAPFAEGVVLMLLLKRRDLPRVFVSIAADGLSYSLCNSIRHSLKVANSAALAGGRVVVGPGLSTRKACAVDNDRLYSSTLESVVGYSYDATTRTLLLRNTQGEDVLSFSRA